MNDIFMNDIYECVCISPSLLIICTTVFDETVHQELHCYMYNTIDQAISTIDRWILRVSLLFGSTPFFSASTTNLFSPIDHVFELFLLKVYESDDNL